MFFKLLGLTQFRYLSHVENKVVNFFLNTNLLEPLLMVFSFDLIKADLTTLIDGFSSYFKLEIQHRGTDATDYLILELLGRKEFREKDL
jgi:hypothetical protein